MRTNYYITHSEDLLIPGTPPLGQMGTVFSVAQGSLLEKVSGASCGETEEQIERSKGILEEH